MPISGRMIFYLVILKEHVVKIVFFGLASLLFAIHGQSAVAVHMHKATSEKTAKVNHQDQKTSKKQKSFQKNTIRPQSTPKIPEQSNEAPIDRIFASCGDC